MKAAVGIVLSLLTAGLTACGSTGQAAGEQVPQLSRQLQIVDQTLSDHRYRKAKKQLAQLTGLVHEAKNAGTLEAGQASDILAAAADLRAALPASSQIASPTPTPTPSPVVTEPDSSGDEGDNAGEGDENGNSNQAKKEHPDPNGKAKGHDK